MKNVRILLVDDNPEFLKSARTFLSGHPHLEEVANVSSGKAALELIGDLSPDLLLMDIVMPGMNGIETTRRIKVLPSDHPQESL